MHKLTLTDNDTEGELAKLFFLYQEAVFPSIDFDSLTEKVTESLIGENTKGDTFIENVNLIKNFKQHFKQSLENEYRRSIQRSIEEMERRGTSKGSEASLASKSKFRSDALSDGGIRGSRDSRNSRRKSKSVERSDGERNLEDALGKILREQEDAERDSKPKSGNSKKEDDREREAKKLDAIVRAAYGDEEGDD